jgi:hypothetical protein
LKIFTSACKFVDAFGLPATVFRKRAGHQFFPSSFQMEVLSKEIKLGELKIEVTIHNLSQISQVKASDIFHAYLTARDEKDRKIWSTPVLEEGRIKHYSSVDEAFQDAIRKVNDRRQTA